MNKEEYNNLTELLLNVVRSRPGMYLGVDHISRLPNFILGYRFCNQISPGKPDFYFGDNGFLKWYEEKYRLTTMSFWQSYFLMEAEEDESKALKLYFDKLEEYYNWYKSISTVTN
jgi:hypothetical protein